jgi:hypothetical protein
MASIRCPNCNLLNFDTAPECKKCRQPLGNSAAPEAAYAGFGTDGRYQTISSAPAVSSAPSASSYYEPPPPNYYNDLRGGHDAPVVNHGYTRTITISIPPVCVKCGDPNNVSMRKFKKDYTPPAAYLGILVGPIPLLIILLIARKRHKLNGLFCTECWSKFKNYGTISAFSALGVLGLIFGGIFFTFAFNKPLVSLFGVVTAIGLGIYSSYYLKKISPKFVNTNRQQVNISIPGYGECEFTNSAR